MPQDGLSDIQILQKHFGRTRLGELRCSPSPTSRLRRDTSTRRFWRLALVDGSSCSEFASIYNHCGVMAAWRRKTLKFLEKFFAFFGKTTPYGTVFKILLGKFLSRHRSTCCVQILLNLADGWPVKSCVDYLTKTDLLQISSKSVYFRRSYSRTREGRSFSP